MAVMIDIEGYEGLYAITDDGSVFSYRLQRFLKTSCDGCGYKFAPLLKNGNKWQPKVHTLVAKAFIPNPDNFPIINHIDGVKTNNHVTNLEWCTQSHNIRHAFAMGLSNQKGQRNAHSKLSDSDVVAIRRLVASGSLQKDVAFDFGVSNPTVCNIVKRKTWTHLPEEMAA